MSGEKLRAGKTGIGYVVEQKMEQVRPLFGNGVCKLLHFSERIDNHKLYGYSMKRNLKVKRFL